MDNRPFAGMTALVTGGARRLGRIMCLRLATLGANVVVHYNTSSVQAFQLTSELQAKSVEASAVQADLSDPAQAATLIDAARKAAGTHLDFLVNNASSFPTERLATLDWNGLSEAMRTNAWAPFELTRRFAAQARKSGGAVVNIIDSRTADYDWNHAGYILAKRTLADLTQFSAVEFAPFVRVNGVSPGPVLLPDSQADETLQRLARHLPLRRTPSPDDVADAVLYLLGARGVTGAILPVDGGRHLGKAVFEDEAQAQPESARPNPESSTQPSSPTPPKPARPAKAPSARSRTKARAKATRAAGGVRGR